MSAQQIEDSAMIAVRNRFESSGLSLHALGMEMGYPEESARKSAWQFMRTKDPRISMLRKFAKAMGIKVTTLLRDADGKATEQTG